MPFFLCQADYYILIICYLRIDFKNWKDEDDDEDEGQGQDLGNHTLDTQKTFPTLT